MADQRRQPSPVPDAPPLIGRDRELATLRDALTAALSGRGSLVLIGGEAGIGKTALAEALLTEATSQGALVLVGRCYDLAETPPHGPWAEALARAPRDQSLPTPPDLAGRSLTSQADLFAAVRDYLATLAALRPVVLLLEDLHWADPASLDILRIAARHLGDEPLLLLATYRADEVTRGQPLFALLPLLAREARAVRLDLRPLDTAAIGALVATRYVLPDPDLARLRAYLAERSEGNALFLGELLRTLEGEGVLRQMSAGWQLGDLATKPIPALLRQVIAGRLHRLSTETERLLAVAAVIGQEVPLALWAAVAEMDEEALLDHAERALAARLLIETPDGASVRFAHALIREVLYEAIPALRRRGVHRRAAEALVAAPSPDPDEVANQFQRAGDPRAVEWLVRAGLRARSAAAWISAAGRFERALALLAEDEGRLRARGWLQYLCGRLLSFSDTARALDHYDAAVPLAQRSGDGALLAVLRDARGRVRCFRGEIRSGIAEVERGVAELETLPVEQRRLSGDAAALAGIATLLPGDGGGAAPPPAGVQPGASLLHANLANWYGWVGRYREAQATSATVIEQVVARPDTDQLQQARVARQALGHSHAALGRLSEARSAYALSRAGFEASGDTFMVECSAWVELLLAVLPYQAEDIAERDRLVAEASRAWSRAADTIVANPHGAPATLLLALLEGRWAEARRLAEEGRTASTSAYAQGARVALGFLARNQGAPELAWAQVRALHPVGAATEPGGCHFAHGVALQAIAANLALDAGDLPLAGRWIAAHGRWLDWSGAVLWRAEHLLLRARHAWLSGDSMAALAHAEAALARAGEPRQPLALLAAHRTLGELDTASGRYVEAHAHLESALALADACAAPYERALTLLALAELYAVTDERERAGTALRDARAILATLQATPALDRALALADRLDAPPAASPRDATVPFGLTAREVEVLRLLAEGLTDPQIAERLFVSRNTVATHVRAVYGKLGVGTRAAAARLALEHGLA